MRWGRAYFAVQAVAGLAWWIAVFAVPVVRETTLGSLDPVIVASFDIPLFVFGSALAALGIRAAAVVVSAWTGFVAAALAVFATITTEAGWGVLFMVAATGASLVALSLMVLGRIPTESIIYGPFAFRPAPAGSSVTRNVVTTFGQIVLMWGLFLGVFPVVISALEARWGVGMPLPTFTIPVGIVVLALASGLGIWSAITMSTLGAGTPLPSAMPNQLVIAGPYRWIRNPMAVAGIVQGAAVGLMLQSWLVVVYAIAGSLVWNYAVRPLEERDLEQRFGAEYRRYRDAVWCWVPRMPRA
ncbi:MAG: methyltransferase family protein [Rhodoglobus sp.]